MARLNYSPSFGNDIQKSYSIIPLLTLLLNPRALLYVALINTSILSLVKSSSVLCRWNLITLNTFAMQLYQATTGFCRQTLIISELFLFTTSLSSLRLYRPLLLRTDPRYTYVYATTMSSSILPKKVADFCLFIFRLYFPNISTIMWKFSMLMPLIAESSTK